MKGFKESLQGGLNNQVNIDKIKKWENALAEHLHEFLFLNYETAIFRNGSSQRKEIHLFSTKGLVKLLLTTTFFNSCLYILLELYEVIHNTECKHRQNITYAKRKSAEKEGGHIVRKRISATEFNGNSSQYNVLAGLAQRTITSGSES